MEHTTSPLTHNLVDHGTYPTNKVSTDGGISLRRSNTSDSNQNQNNMIQSEQQYNSYRSQQNSDNSSQNNNQYNRKSSNSYLSTSMMVNYFLCINLDLSQYRFMLSLVFVMYIFYFIIEIFHVVNVGKDIGTTPSAILAIVATCFTIFILACIAKLIYIPTRNTALVSSATILFLQLIFIIQTILYYNEVQATPGYVISTIVVMILQILSAMLLYRYWEYVTFYYAGGPDGVVDLRAIVADISMNNSSTSYNYNPNQRQAVYSIDNRILTPPPALTNDNNNTAPTTSVVKDTYDNNVPPSEIKPRQLSTSQHSMNVSQRITLSQQSTVGNSLLAPDFSNSQNETITHEEILTQAYGQQGVEVKSPIKQDIES